MKQAYWYYFSKDTLTGRDKVSDAILKMYPREAIKGIICGKKFCPQESTWDWVCTRPVHHDGIHVAHAGDQVITVWGDEITNEKLEVLLIAARLLQ